MTSRKLVVPIKPNVWLVIPNKKKFLRMAKELKTEAVLFYKQSSGGGVGK